jgi:hypothetical protein
MSDETLQELLSFIDGSAGHGVGMRSYITDDLRQQKIHEGCLELERRGKIERHVEDGDMVIWMPREAGKRAGIIKGAQIGEIALPNGAGGQ